MEIVKEKNEVNIKVDYRESQENQTQDITQPMIKLRMPRLHQFKDDIHVFINPQLNEEMNIIFSEICSICGQSTNEELKAVDDSDNFLCYNCATEVLANITVQNIVNNIVQNECYVRESQHKTNSRVTFSTKVTPKCTDIQKEVISPLNIVKVKGSEDNVIYRDTDESHFNKNTKNFVSELNSNKTDYLNSNDVISKNEINIPMYIGEDVLDQYVKGEMIGSGQFGNVFKVLHKTNGIKAAAKEISYSRSESKEEIFKEIEILKYLSESECILQLYDVIDCCHTKIKKMILITEYLDGGDLFSQITNEDLLTETQVVRIMTQILEGVLFMHNKEIIHRDLKPENIMYSSTEIDRIKIIDFGFAVRYDKNNPPKSMVGTTIFVAPEVLSYENQCYQTDIWSIGVIAYNLLTGITPFEIPTSGDLDRQLTDIEIIENIQRCQYDFEDEGFIDVSEEAKTFISLILIRQPQKRLTAEQCLRHCWINISKDGKGEYNRSISIQRMKNYVALRKWEKLRIVIQSLSNFKTI